MNHPDDMILMQVSCHRTNSEVIDMIFTHAHTSMHAPIHTIHTCMHAYIPTYLHYIILYYIILHYIIIHYITLQYYIILHCITLQYYIILHCITLYYIVLHYFYVILHYYIIYICMIIYFGHGMTFGPVKSGLHHNFSVVLSLTFQTVTIFAVYETIYISSIDVVGTSTT